MDMISYAITAPSIFYGAFLWMKPKTAIELQKRFYEKINWRMEPICLEKELKNTRIMGASLLMAAFAAAAYVFFM